MPAINDKLIVALDVDTLERAERFVDILYPQVKLFKVGSQLFTAHGPEAIKMIGAKGGRVFLDLKLHDIPNTVKNAVYTGTSQQAVFMMTVHTEGGIEMMRYASEGAVKKAAELKIERPFIVGVTVLTSSATTLEEVVKRALTAKNAGLDGVVCSVHEAPAVRKNCGKDFILVTPGIRSQGEETADQKRVATAQDAIQAGANFIVVGRPILEANDPLAVAEELLSSCRS
ncbi:MAG: orotidine-5'-phosphate decarboxylase [Candidatus Omnitrophota bacterium]|jgi:orotidine-5'-phosphate decarboxylase|nr:MAG: orotidine-5'-phosphate decarboxylase [Candidatus Omnitrophota bacterium]